MARSTPLGRAAIAILVAFTFIHGDCSGLFNSLLPGPSIQAATPDDPAINTGSSLVYGCSTNSSQGSTPYATWKLSWSDHTTTHGYILWPKGGSSSPATILFWDDPANASVTYNAVQQAVRFWQSNLTNASTAAGGYMKIGLQVSGNNADYTNANVVAEDSTTTYLPQDRGGLIGGDESFLKYSPDFSTLVAARIVLNANLDSTTTYVNALHEIGHSLGLDHSRYEWSVMFPYNTSCVNLNSTKLSYGDLQWLLTQYDPRWAPGSSPCVNNGTCGGGPRRLASVVPPVTPGRSYPIVPRGARTMPFGAPSPLEQYYMSRPSRIYGHPRARWGAVEDLDHAELLSMDSQWLASTLVGTIRIVDEHAGELRHGALRTEYKVARVDTLLKHLEGPDAARKDGDEILLADTTMADGDELIDDLALHQSDGETLVFLRRTNGVRMLNGRPMPIYSFTSAFNSKFALAKDGTLSALSVRNTVVNSALTAKSLGTVIALASGRPVAEAQRALGSPDAERAVMNGIFARNGLTSASAVSQYAATLSRDPHGYYESRAIADENRAHALHPNALRHWGP